MKDSCPQLDPLKEPKVCPLCDMKFLFTKTKCSFNSHQVLYPQTVLQKSLQGLLLNTRSLIKHNIEFAELLEAHNIDMAFFTETWADGASDPELSLAIPEGYLLIRNDRQEKRGGEIAIIIKDTLSMKSSTSGSGPDCELLSFGITISENYIFNGILLYRPPGAKNKFVETKGHIIESSFDFQEFSILGDFNYHLENINDQYTISFLELMASVLMEQLIKHPTHEDGHTLDGIFISNPQLKVQERLPIPCSDHKAIRLVLTSSHHLTRPHSALRTFKGRNWKEISPQQLQLTLAASKPTLMPEVNTSTNIFTNWIATAVNILAPEKTFTSKWLKKSEPWSVTHCASSSNYADKLKGAGEKLIRKPKKWFIHSH